jgi:hypothetical protein
MADYRIAFLKTFHRFSDFLHPPGILMTHDVRQFHVRRFVPNALNYMKVSATHARATYSNKYVRILFEFRFRNFLPKDEVGIGKTTVIFVEYSGFHREDRGFQLAPNPLRSGMWKHSTFVRGDRDAFSDAVI